VGWDNVVGRAIHYGLDSVRIEIPVRVRFPATIQIGPGAHQISYTMGTGSLLGVKQLGSGEDHQPHLAPRLKNE